MNKITHFLSANLLRMLCFSLSLMSIAAAQADDPRNNTDALINDVVRTAETYLGTPHRLGGLNNRGIDCSGLMVKSFESVGITMPRTAQEQAMLGEKVTQRQLTRGDLVFFKVRGKVNHVGLVTRTQGDQVWFIHTSSSRGVMISTLGDAYWRDGFTFGRRVWTDPVVTRRRPTLPSPSFASAPGRFPEGSSRELTRKEIKQLPAKQAEMMQKEIWARNGYRFKDNATQRYFEGQEWYRNMDTTRRKGKVQRSFSDIEKKNLKRLQKIADLDKIE
ncbi:MAG: NlpC/P60 family protein [Bacteroidia bacterium]|nr:NlpC/P60 family protein [Bacteroidia bacterium]